MLLCLESNNGGTGNFNLNSWKFIINKSKRENSIKEISISINWYKTKIGKINKIWNKAEKPLIKSELSNPKNINDKQNNEKENTDFDKMNSYSNPIYPYKSKTKTLYSYEQNM